MEEEAIEMIEDKETSKDMAVARLLNAITAILTAFTKLIQVKSLVTLCLTAAFIWLTCNQALDEHFLTIYSMIITFYFVNQVSKS